MPHFTPTTPTIDRKIGSIAVSVPTPFETGHALTANEAKWVNSQLASVVTNAYSSDIRRALEAANKDRPKGAADLTADYLDWDHQAKFNEKFEEYELGVSNRGSGLTPKDPVESLMRTLATAKVKAILVKRGLKVKEYMDAKEADGETSVFAGMVRDYLARFNDDLRANAEAQLAVTADEDTEVEVPDLAA